MIELFLGLYGVFLAIQIVRIFLEITPKDIDLDEIKTDIRRIKGVVDIHHIHVRSMDGGENHATLHVVVKKIR